ncbi:MSHA biogenesis protein MshI [Gammaproteobacteria bacterium]
MGWFSQSKVVQGWLAVQVWTDRVSVVDVYPVANGKPRITFCQTRGTEGAADILKRLAREVRARGRKTVGLLNTGEYQLLLVEAPNVPEEEIRAAVRWSIKDQLDYPVDTATLDVLPVPADSFAPTRSVHLYVAVVRNNLLAERQRLIEEAGFPLSVIDIPELAQRNLATLIEEPERGLALLSLDSSGGLLTLTCDGKLYLARRTEVNLLQVFLHSPEQQQVGFERLALDVQRAIDYFDRQFRSIALSRLVLAVIPPECGLEDYLANNLSLPVSSASLKVFFDFDEMPELSSVEQQAECLLTLGAALRLPSKP